MTDEQQQYFAAMESLFASTGWRLMTGDVQAWRDAIAIGLVSVTPDLLRREQGRIEMADQILSYEKNHAANKALVESGQLVVGDDDV